MAKDQSTNLSCGIVGLPNVGKSTLFSAITRKKVSAENYPFCTIDPNIGIVEVADQRLIELSKLSNSKKTVYATISFVDIAGLVEGASKGEGLGNKFLSNIRDTDAIIHVVRCFEDEELIHVSGRIDPLSDIETINLELILSDLQTAENIKVKLEKKARFTKDKTEMNLIDKIIDHLNQNQVLRLISFTLEEKEFLKNWAFLTLKKVIYVANIKEEELNDLETNKNIQIVKEYTKKENSTLICISAKIEQEIATLEPDDAKEFLKELGLKDSGLNQLIKASFNLLHLISFITTGEIETRAWTIVKGTSAKEAAGKIHTDIEKGFIRAEVVSYTDIIQYKGRVQAREAGKALSQGKEYIVQDGDVILFFHA
ncbi:MAG: Ribosome-binding ATPase YchF [Candidatus Anoxychlamydiales bacterium]|nr:Ribosome-binding ATPase YchF [Candidatus Anoxychlamydiales bacterium]NGX35265.1 Ribosome-binding ATPase YchF [Candidatus Anoxychlamydiales bacterium]